MFQLCLYTSMSQLCLYMLMSYMSPFTSMFQLSTLECLSYGSTPQDLNCLFHLNVSSVSIHKAMNRSLIHVAFMVYLSPCLHLVSISDLNVSAMSLFMSLQLNISTVCLHLDIHVSPMSNLCLNSPSQDISTSVGNWEKF